MGQSEAIFRLESYSSCSQEMQSNVSDKVMTVAENAVKLQSLGRVCVVEVLDMADLSCIASWSKASTESLLHWTNLQPQKPCIGLRNGLFVALKP
jgi:hypothetical protein